MWRYSDHITVSNTLSFKDIDPVLRTPGLFFDDTHVLYPADERGAHLLRFFSVEPLPLQVGAVDRITADIAAWIDREAIRCEVVFAPAQPGVAELAGALARALEGRAVFLDYLPTGRFGDQIREGGSIRKGERVLVFNGVTHQGGCVGKRLPDYAAACGGETVGAAVFAKGTSGAVVATEKRFGASFYACLQVDVPAYDRQSCPKCLAGDTASLRPWTHLREV